MNYLIITLAILAATCGAYERKDCYVDGNQCAGPYPTPHPGEPGPAGDRGSPGTDGANGNSGAPGMDGYDVVTLTETIAAGDYFCPAGGTRLRIARDLNRNGVLDSQDDRQQVASICTGAQGAQGPAGSNGAAGSDGKDGVDGKDGTNGTNGQDAPVSNFQPVGLIDPCGDAPGIYDEVFLHLQNGTILASFSDNANGQNTRFSVLSPGSYIVTDGSGCKFSVDTAGNLYNEHY